MDEIEKHYSKIIANDLKGKQVKDFINLEDDIKITHNQIQSLSLINDKVETLIQNHGENIGLFNKWFTENIRKLGKLLCMWYFAKNQESYIPRPNFNDELKTIFYNASSIASEVVFILEDILRENYDGKYIKYGGIEKLINYCNASEHIYNDENRCLEFAAYEYTNLEINKEVILNSSFYLIVPYSYDDIDDSQKIYDSFILFLKDNPIYYKMVIELSYVKSRNLEGYVVAVYGDWEDQIGPSLPIEDLPPYTDVYQDYRNVHKKKREYIYMVKEVLNRKKYNHY